MSVARAGVSRTQFQRADRRQESLPVEGRTGIALVGLEVEVPEHAVEGGFLLVAERIVTDAARRVARNVELDPWKDLRERGRERRERAVLLGREVVLHEDRAVDRPGDELVARRPTAEVCAQPAVAGG